MSILSVIKRVIMVCEEYNKAVKDIDIQDGLLLVQIENGIKFGLPYRFMTEQEIEDKIISACEWSC